MGSNQDTYIGIDTTADVTFRCYDADIQEILSTRGTVTYTGVGCNAGSPLWLDPGDMCWGYLV